MTESSNENLKKSSAVESHYKLVKTKVKDVQKDIETNRNEFIGGSDIGTIMGCNPFKSAYTLWAEKTGLIEAEDISDKEAVWWGSQTEDLIAKRFMMKTGLKVNRSNYAYGVEQIPYFKGHIDRIGTNNKFGLECKSTSSYNKTNYGEGEVPEQHWWQCQFYMFVTGINEWYLATHKGNSEFYIARIARDDDAIKTMIEACSDFWEHVQSGEPVEVDGSSSTEETLAEVYPEENPGTVIDISKMEDHLLAIDATNEQIAGLNGIVTGYKNEIKAVMGDAEVAETETHRVVWKVNVRGTRVFKITQKKEKENDRN